MVRYLVVVYFSAKDEGTSYFFTDQGEALATEIYYQEFTDAVVVEFYTCNLERAAQRGHENNSKTKELAHRSEDQADLP